MLFEQRAGVCSFLEPEVLGKGAVRKKSSPGPCSSQEEGWRGSKVFHREPWCSVFAQMKCVKRQSVCVHGDGPRAWCPVCASHVGAQLTPSHKNFRKKEIHVACGMWHVS